MSYLNYCPFDHGEANTEPAGDENENILGLELEIAEMHDYSYLNELISEGFIETEDSEPANIQLEYEAQHNVQYELIFNADLKENILSRLDEVVDLRNDCRQHHETSCHVHLNRSYLYDIGLDEIQQFIDFIIFS